MLPLLSATPAIVAEMSFHPTTTTFRLPAVCKAVRKPKQNFYKRKIVVAVDLDETRLPRSQSREQQP